MDPLLPTDSGETDKTPSFTRKSTFARTWTENFAFPRAFSQAVGLDFDAEDAWTRRLLEEYGRHQKEQVGDMPGMIFLLILIFSASYYCSP